MFMKISRLSVAGAGIALATGILALLPSSPASAATPNCTTGGQWSSTNSGVGFVTAPLNSSRTTAKCALERGANNSAVRALQSSIVKCYGINIAIDGDFGGNTFNALKTVQGRIGAGVDGEYGPQTASLIKMVPTVGSTCGRLY